MEQHHFFGKWITTAEFSDLPPRNVFHRQLQPTALSADEHQNRHILFRKHFTLSKKPQSAVIFLSADDCYHLYINGKFVGLGPAPAYPFSYGYRVLDVTAHLESGENVIAVHTLYQGLINRVWVSGDHQHGLLMDLEVDGQTLVSSDRSFLTAYHAGYEAVGTIGYQTQFREKYDSRAPQVGFEAPDFDDSDWVPAVPRKYPAYSMALQTTEELVFEKRMPVSVKRGNGKILFDFGACYVGYAYAEASGKRDSLITVRCGQELTDEGELRYELRANACYEEPWILSGEQDSYRPFDYKSFRYVEFLLPEGCTLTAVSLYARHYPFSLVRTLREEYRQDERLSAIWRLAVRTQKYGVQEVIQDCMEREKGFYVGDGCYTALTHMILTGKDDMVRKLIDDAFLSTRICPTTVTCLDCSFMQEIAEYPLMLLQLILWHWRTMGDRDYLSDLYPRVCQLLDAYREAYAGKDGLLAELDKWCVVEWPPNFRDGYDVDLQEGKVCHPAHLVLNAYWYEAHCAACVMAEALGVAPPYTERERVKKTIITAFYDPARHLFTDRMDSDHVSYVGSVFAFAYRLAPDTTCTENICHMIEERGMAQLSLFGSFALMLGLVRAGRSDLLKRCLCDGDAWLRMLREDGTTTFEGWGKDCKWNTSLFHMTLSDVAVFLSDADLDRLFL